ncbi:hypothetical protein BH10PLA1_BH10PLA1_20120 [soil metagenome]
MIDDERSLPDDAFLRQCRVETFRGPCPGGQKRNKTSSGVRITHLPTGLHAIATESRSQATNRANALRQLRLRAAIERRLSVDLATFRAPDWFTTAISTSNPMYPQVVGVVLDVLAAANWSTADAREVLGVASRPFTNLLHSDAEMWSLVQRERESRGLRALTST